MDALSIISIVFGIMLFLFTFADLFMTVFMIGGGAGPQSNFVADRLWRASLRLHRPKNDLSHSLMRAVGPMIVLVALATWVLQLIASWALIFVPTAFMEPSGISFGDRMLFAGRSIVGRSGNTPELGMENGIWEAVQSFSGVTGVIVVSVGLAYVLPILASVAHKRSIAATIHSLGDGVDRMVELGSTAGGSSFELHLVALIPSIALSAERHRSYPVLHYFHSRDPHAALATSIAKLVILMQSDLSKMPRVDLTVKEPLSHVIQNLLDAVAGMGLKKFAYNNGSIDSSKLGNLDIGPRQPPPSTRIPEIEWLKAYVLFDGWDWETIEEGALKTLSFMNSTAE